MHFSNPRKSLVYIEHNQLLPDTVQSTAHVNLKYYYNFYKENEIKLWSILLKVYIKNFHPLGYFLRGYAYQISSPSGYYRVSTAESVPQR
jgi:hypothetical protein